MPWADFDDENLIILQVMINTLIPPDEHPGGWEGGVATYLELSFQSHLRQFVPYYQDSIRALGRKFLDQNPEDRIETLRNFDQQFVNLAAMHAAEGYYASPGPGWQMIGFEVTA